MTSQPPLKSNTDKSIEALLDRHFVFVTGKGGVGKSTVAAIIALEAAARGKRVLVVYPEGGQPHDRLWGKPISLDPSPVAAGVDATVADSETAMRQYSAQILKQPRLVNLLFHSRVAKGFLTGIPGLTDWAILGKAWAYTRSGAFQLPAGQHSYDLVILDAPASGDGTKMLRVPDVILDMGATGRIGKDAATCKQMLSDPGKTALVLVSLAEELVVEETEENLQLISEELHVALGPLFINQILPEVFSSGELSEVQRFVAEHGGAMKREPNEAAHELLSLGEAAAIKQQRQAVHIERLRSHKLPLVLLPRISADLQGLFALRKLQLALAPRA